MTEKDLTQLEKVRSEQMLKLVSQSFYKELVKFGIKSEDIVTVSMNLLDHVTKPSDEKPTDEIDYTAEFSIADIQNMWQTHRTFSFGNISIKVLYPRLIPEICSWMRNESISETYIHLFPKTEKALDEYLLKTENRKYFAIYSGDQFVGIIGGENINDRHKKLEMKKFVGAPAFTGKGIGKTATFLFLYFVFEVLKYNKVYIHSMDTNIRNINLNAKFGFELEGVFFRELQIQNEYRDSVRMGLLKSKWSELFSA